MRNNRKKPNRPSRPARADAQQKPQKPPRAAVPPRGAPAQAKAAGGNVPPKRRPVPVPAPAAPEARTRRRSGKGRPGDAPRPSARKERPRREHRPATKTIEATNIENDLAEEEAPELGIGSRVIAPNVRFDPGPGPDEPAPRSEPTRDVEAQIRALEARLDGLIRRATVPSDEPAPPSVRDEIPDTPRNEVERIASRPAKEPDTTPPPSSLDSVPPGYLERKWGREALRSRFEEVDDFGLDPAIEQKVRPAFDLLYRRYFRVQVEGIEHVPGAGRAVIVANHGGTLPLDGAMLRTAMRLDHPSGRDLRWLAEDFVFYLPFAGVFLNRIGAVRACPENAERLLEKDALIAVFPEGLHGIKKLFHERYRLQRFGRGGYIRLCLRARAPLVPCAIIGAEETNPLLYRFESLATLFKLPYLPVTPTFPLLGPVGLLPAPTRWKLKFGEPISFDHYGPEAADDHVLVGRLSERVRAAIQGLIDSGLRERKSVWFG